MSPPRVRARRRPPPEELAAAVTATERWFVTQGLPYFVPGERQSARRALRSRRSVLLLVLAVVVSFALGVVLARFVGDPALAAATPTLLVGGGVLAFAATTLRAAPIARYAVRRTVSGLRLIVPLVTRALPLLLLAITFLFINAEVWQVSATLDGAKLWLVVVLFGTAAVLFFLVRLPDEVDAADTQVTDEQLVAACRATPMEKVAADVVTDHPASEMTDVRGYERANLVLVLLVAQAAQVLLVSVAVFGFLMLFGGVAMTRTVQESWIQDTSNALPVLTNLSVELAQVSVFLAAFAGLSFTIYAVTDDTYRDQFFTQVKSELDRAVGVRAVYLAARAEAVTADPGDSDAPGPR